MVYRADRDDPERDASFRAAQQAADRRGITLRAHRSESGWQAIATRLSDRQTVTVERWTAGQAAWGAIIELGAPYSGQ